MCLRTQQGRWMRWICFCVVVVVVGLCYSQDRLWEEVR